MFRGKSEEKLWEVNSRFALSGKSLLSLSFLLLQLPNQLQQIHLQSQLLKEERCLCKEMIPFPAAGSRKDWPVPPPQELLVLRELKKKINQATKK